MMPDESAEGGPRLHAPRLERRHQVIRTDNTRSLLTVVAVEFLLPTGGSAWTSTFIEILGRFGVQPGAVRQALSRAADPDRPDCFLTSESVGRRKCWRLTSEGRAMLRDSTARAFQREEDIEPWDGSWLVVLASVPEDDRSSRYLVRSRLVWAGLGSPAPGVWVGTHPSRLAEVEEALDLAGIHEQARVFVAQHAHLDQMRAMVTDAWDIDGIAREYEHFVRRFRHRRAADALTAVIELVAAWTWVVLQDPGLPSELLPRPWPGTKAATIFSDRHERWMVRAKQQWDEINDDSRK